MCTLTVLSSTQLLALAIFNCNFHCCITVDTKVVLSESSFHAMNDIYLAQVGTQILLILQLYTHRTVYVFLHNCKDVVIHKNRKPLVFNFKHSGFSVVSNTFMLNLHLICELYLSTCYLLLRILDSWVLKSKHQIISFCIMLYGFNFDLTEYNQGQCHFTYADIKQPQICLYHLC